MKPTAVPCAQLCKADLGGAEPAPAPARPAPAPDHFGLVRTGTADLTGDAVQEGEDARANPVTHEAVSGGLIGGDPLRVHPLLFARVRGFRLNLV